VPAVKGHAELVAFCESINIDYDGLAAEAKRKAQVTMANIAAGNFPQYEGMTADERLLAILSSEWTMGALTGIIARKLYDEG
jgi:hypothetical protein